jgi:ribosomal protein S27AE
MKLGDYFTHERTGQRFVCRKITHEAGGGSVELVADAPAAAPENKSDEVRYACPKCGCTQWDTGGFSTADTHTAWKDLDGKWYSGPAIQSVRRSCAACGWAQEVTRKRGKLETVKSDPV